MEDVTLQKKEAIYIYKFEFFKGRYTNAVMYNIPFVKEDREVPNSYPVIINRYKDHGLLCPLNVDMIREIEEKIIMSDVMNDRVKFIMYSFSDAELESLNSKIREMNLSIGIDPDTNLYDTLEVKWNPNVTEDNGSATDNYELDL